MVVGLAASPGDDFVCAQVVFRFAVTLDFSSRHVSPLRLPWLFLRSFLGLFFAPPLAQGPLNLDLAQNRPPGSSTGPHFCGRLACLQGSSIPTMKVNVQTPKLESKRIFLIASDDSSVVSSCRDCIETHIAAATVFTAGDGAEALRKVDNSLPHVVILDASLSKIDVFTVADRILALNGEHVVSLILLTPLPANERYVDQVVTCQVQFLPDYRDETKLAQYLSRALNRVSLEEESSYRLMFLSPTEVLFREGAEANSVFFVKKGKLEVVKDFERGHVLIGEVAQGEFVGEMAHFNGEPRSATVRAISDCELIEIPSGTLDMILFSKPSWAKALMATLARRLKRTNDQIAKSAK